MTDKDTKIATLEAQVAALEAKLNERVWWEIPHQPGKEEAKPDLPFKDGVYPPRLAFRSENDTAPQKWPDFRKGWRGRVEKRFGWEDEKDFIVGPPGHQDTPTTGFYYRDGKLLFTLDGDKQYRVDWPSRHVVFEMRSHDYAARKMLQFYVLLTGHIPADSTREYMDEHDLWVFLRPVEEDE